MEPMVYFEHEHETETAHHVVLARTTEPRFFAGALRSGRPVWVHKHEDARPVPQDRVHLYEERTGEELLAMWPANNEL